MRDRSEQNGRDNWFVRAWSALTKPWLDLAESQARGDTPASALIREHHDIMDIVAIRRQKANEPLIKEPIELSIGYKVQDQKLSADGRFVSGTINIRDPDSIEVVRQANKPTRRDGAVGFSAIPNVKDERTLGYGISDLISNDTIVYDDDLSRVSLGQVRLRARMAAADDLEAFLLNWKARCDAAGLRWASDGVYSEFKEFLDGAKEVCYGKEG